MVMQKSLWYFEASDSEPIPLQFLEPLELLQVCKHQGRTHESSFGLALRAEHSRTE